MVRGKRIESSDVPSVIELPRISYHNVGASLDISSISPGLQIHVGHLIEHLGEEFACKMPFVPNNVRFKVLYKRFLEDSNNCAKYKATPTYIGQQNDLLQQKRLQEESYEISEEEELPPCKTLMFDATPSSYDKLFAKYYT